MSFTREQVAAVVFSALMLTSVVGGSIALGGVAATDTSKANLNSGQVSGTVPANTDSISLGGGRVDSEVDIIPTTSSVQAVENNPDAYDDTVTEPNVSQTAPASDDRSNPPAPVSNDTGDSSTPSAESATTSLTGESADIQSDSQRVDVAPSDLAGSGTQADPYLITNASELQALEDNLTANYTLGSDINASETAAWNGGAGFDPIGVNPFVENESGFTGSLDGANHTITGLVINRPSENTTALLGGNEGTVADITLKNANITGARFMGGLVGINTGVIHNATVFGNVSSTAFTVGGVAGSNFGQINQSRSSVSVSGPSTVGGFVGYNSNSGQINNTTSSATVTAPEFDIGGFAGFNNGTLADVAATGAISGPNFAAGGLVGDSEGIIINATATAPVNASSGTFVGGLVGISSDGAEVSNSTAEGVVNGSNTVGGLVGGNYYNATIRESVARGNVSANDVFAGGAVGTNFEGVVIETTASGTASGPDDVGGLIGASFFGTVRNVTASGAVVGSESNIGGLVGRNSGGTVNGAVASGNVNGSDEVGGLIGSGRGSVMSSEASGDINGSEEVGGLVGRKSSGSITNSEASGSVNGSNSVGGGVGFNEGFVVNTTAYGTVNGSDSVGGLVGRQIGLVANGSSTGGVNGFNEVGGLVGSNEGLIKTANAAGDVTGISSVGGLVGTNEGGINTARAVGNVTGSDEVGGLVGRNEGDVANAFAAGTVGGGSNVGGVAGVSTGMESDSYWDEEATTQSVSAGAATNLTTAEIIGDAARDNMLGLEFGSTWQTQPGSYPTLTGELVVPNKTGNISLIYDASGAGSSTTRSGLEPGFVASEALQVVSEDETGFRFGGTTGHSIRVVVPRTGESLTITPQEDIVETLPILGVDLDGVYDSEGTLENSPDIQLALSSGVVRPEVSVEGNERIFEPQENGSDPFKRYKIQLVDEGGTVIAETDAETHGIGYRAVASQNSTTGTIRASVTRQPGVNESWYVRYTLSSGIDLTKEVTNNNSDDRFNITIDSTTLQPGNYSQEIEIYKSESNSLGDRIIGIRPFSDLRVEQSAQETAPSITAPDAVEYDPTQPFTLGTSHNATGEINSSDVAIRLVNVTDGNTTAVALNDTVPVEGQANTTIATRALAGNVTIEAQLYNNSTEEVVATDRTAATPVEPEAPADVAPFIIAPPNATYDPTTPFTVGTGHNATGVIARGDVAIRLVNISDGNGTVVAVNDSVPVAGDVNTTVPADSLAGNVTIETQLYNNSSGQVVATDTVALTTDAPVEEGDGDAAQVEVDTAASFIQPATTTAESTHEYQVSVEFNNIPDNTTSGEVDVEFEGFSIAGDPDDDDANELTIDFTAANVTNDSLEVSANLNATAPSTAGAYDVAVTDLRQGDGSNATFLLEDTNIAIGVISVTESVSNDTTSFITGASDVTYDPNSQLTVGTFHNATGVIDSDNLSIRLVNTTNSNGSVVAVNNSVPVVGAVNTTVSVGALSGNATIQVQLYNNATQQVVAADVVNLTAVASEGDQTIPDSDNTEPNINAISILNDSVAPGDTLVVEINATDASDIVLTRIDLDTQSSIPFGFEGRDDIRFEKFDQAGLEQEKIRFEIPITEDQVNGTYTLNDVSVTDAAGNEKSEFVSNGPSVVVSNPAVDPETTEPEIREVTIINESVEPGQQVAVDVNAFDQSEITRISVELEETRASFDAFNERIELTAETEAITQNGTTRLTATVPESQVNGEYELRQVNVRDRIGNTFFTSSPAGAGVTNITGGVTRTDREEPQVTELALPEAVAAGNNITVELDTADESRIVSTTVVLREREYFSLPFGVRDRAEIRLQQKSNDGIGETIQLDATIPRNQLNGSYVIDEVRVTDAAQNTRDLSEFDVERRSDLPAGPIEVTNGASTPGDTTPPEITDVTVLNKSVQVGEEVVVSANVSDQSEIRSVEGVYSIQSSPSGRVLFGSRISLTPEDDITTNEAVTLSATVPEGTASGQYNLGIEVTDAVGNDQFIFEFSPLTRVDITGGTAPSDIGIEITEVELLNESVAPGEEAQIRIQTERPANLENREYLPIFSPVVGESKPGLLPASRFEDAAEVNQRNETTAILKIAIPPSSPDGTLRLESLGDDLTSADDLLFGQLLEIQSDGEPSITAPDNTTYDLNSSVTIRTSHDAAGVINSSDVAVQLVNTTGENNTEVALNGSVPVTGEVNTTIPAGSLSGSVTIQAQLYNSSSQEVEATDIIVLAAAVSDDEGSNSVQVDADPADLPGNGTQANPYEISNASGLQAIEDNLDANYELVADVNGTNTSQWNGGHGFDPIGGDPANQSTPEQFNGTFDGNNHTITQITIDRPNQNGVGIFGFTSGTITDVSLTNITVTGRENVGGVVGRINNRGRVETTSVSGNVSAVGEFGSAGGIAGFNRGTIRNVSASGSVSSSFDGGGLVGTHAGIISDAFAVGTVTAVGDSATLGGLVGFNDGIAIQDAYWDTQATGQNTSSGNAVGLTTVEMQGQAARTNMSGLDFGTTWQTQPDDYPTLAALEQDSSSSENESEKIVIEVVDTPARVNDSESFSVNVTLRNNRETTQNESIEFRVDNERIATTTQTIEPKGSASVSITTSVNTTAIRAVPVAVRTANTTRQTELIISGEPPAPEELTVEFTLPNDGNASAVGVPAELNGTLADVIDPQTRGVVVYTFVAGENASWRPVFRDFESVRLEPLDAILIATEGAESQSEQIIVRLPVAQRSATAVPPTKTLEPGFNFVAAPIYGDAQDVFGLDDIFLTVDRFNDPVPVSNDIRRADEFNTVIPAMNTSDSAASPFTGYYVFAESETTIPSVVGGVSTRQGLLTQLNVSSDAGEANDTSDDEYNNTNIAVPASTQVAPPATGDAHILVQAPQSIAATRYARLSLRHHTGVAYAE